MQGSTFLEVSDSGPGISEQHQPHLFEAFFTNRTQGIGIGLAVVKRIVDDHGWRIDARNQETGPGATFRVTMVSPPVV